MLIKLLSRQVQKRKEWLLHQRALSQVTAPEGFREYVNQRKPVDFLHYEGLSAEKRTDFESVVEVLGLELEGKSVLDIGPAYGDMLDISHERGAKDCHFIEYDPIFFTHNRFKGFTTGFHINHLRKRKLRAVESGRYDLIWAKGSIAADFFLKYGWMVLSIDAWLEQIERVTAPGGRILICPYWTIVDGVRLIKDVRGSEFTAAFLRRGYSILDPIPHHNSEDFLPITFSKVMG